MPAKRKPVPPFRLAVHPQLGKGFFDSVGNFFKNAAGKVYEGVKSVASRVKPSQLLGLVPDGRAQAAARAAGAVGLGRKKKTGGKRKATGAGKRGARKTATMAGTGKTSGMIVM